MNVTTQQDDEMPPAAKFARSKLHEADKPLTRLEIQRETGLKKRTLLDALDRLQRAGEVRRIVPEDSEKPRYAIQKHE